MSVEVLRNPGHHEHHKIKSVQPKPEDKGIEPYFCFIKLNVQKIHFMFQGFVIK